MNIAVTGGAGFIGSWVAQLLLTEKRLLPPGVRDAKVAVIDNLSNGLEKNISDFSNHPRFLGLYRIDLKDGRAISELFAEFKFDICYHLAASISVQRSIDDPRETFDNDVVATFNLLEECRAHGTKMVYVSTCMVYAPAHNRPINEFHPTQCASPYAAAKLAGEKLVESYHHAYGLQTVILRPFNTYGPRQRLDGEGGVIAKFLWQKLSGEPITVFGDGSQTRDFTYVEDCARFIVMAGLESELNGFILNAGTGRDVPIRKLAEIIAADKVEIRFVPHPHPQSEKQRLVCDYSLAKNMLGWRPSVELEQGLALTESWLIENFADIREGMSGTVS